MDHFELVSDYKLAGDQPEAVDAIVKGLEGGMKEQTLMGVTGANSVLAAIQVMGGVYMVGRYVPIWAVVLTEFCLAYLLEVLMGSPCSFKLASRVFDPKATHPVLFETAIICATVGLMCPAMSLIAAFLYYPYYAGFHIATLLANWMKLVCFNFPFAFFRKVR